MLVSAHDSRGIEHVYRGVRVRLKRYDAPPINEAGGLRRRSAEVSDAKADAHEDRSGCRENHMKEREDA